MKFSKTKNLVKTSLLAGVLCLPSSASSNNQEKISFVFDGSIRYEQRLVNRVSNIPFELRDIPKSGDSWDEKYRVIIKETDFNACDRFSLPIRTGVKFPLGSETGLILGLCSDFNFNSKKNKINKRSVGEYERRNEGNSISTCETPPIKNVYFCVHPAYLVDSNDLFRLGLFSELETKISKNTALGIGGEIFPEKIIAENGWDREEYRNAKTRYNLANMWVGGIYGSFKFFQDVKEGTMFYSIDAGLTKILRKDISDLGNQMNLNLNDNSWFLGLRIGKRMK